MDISTIVSQLSLLFKIEMISEQQSFRDIYQFPGQGQDARQQRYMKGSRFKKGVGQARVKQTFYGIVQKAKHVAMFSQNLKKKMAQNRTLSVNTLKPNQLEYLQSEAHVQQKQPLFLHDNRILVAIDICFVATMLLFVWMNSFEIVFGEIQGHCWINLAALGMYLLNIVLFNVTEYKNQRQELIGHRNEIMSLYLREKLVRDVAVVVVMVLQLTPLSNQSSQTWLFVAMRIIALISYLQISKKIDKLQNLLANSVQIQSYMSLLKLLFKIIVFLHFLSLILNLLVAFQHHNNRRDTWLDKLDSSGLEYAQSMDRYILAWYWGATILSTVGFGQIVPGNNIQRFFISIVQVTCCMIFGYFVNVIGKLIQVRGQSEDKYEKQMRCLNRILGFLTATNDLKHKIRTHYFNKHIIQKTHDPSQQQQVFKTLPQSLKGSLLQQNNIKFLKKCNALKQFKNQILTSLTQMLGRIIMAPEQKLYSRDTKSRKLWFIENGIIDQYTDLFEGSSLRKKISVYNQKDSTVGWINFLTETPYKTLAKAKNFTVAYELDYDNFRKVLGEDRGSYHKFLQMRQLMIEKNKKHDSKCLSCHRYRHNVIDCPRIHFVKKDIRKLIVQKEDLGRFRQEMKNRRNQRSNLKSNWKGLFARGELEKQANKLLTHQSSIILNATIQAFDMLVRNQNSQRLSPRRKDSFAGILREKARETSASLLNKIEEKSMADSYVQAPSCQRNMQEVEIENQVFEKIFFSGQSEDYMPQHDVGEVLSNYLKRNLKKMKLELQLSRRNL